MGFPKSQIVQMYITTMELFAKGADSPFTARPCDVWRPVISRDAFKRCRWALQPLRPNQQVKPVFGDPGAVRSVSRGWQRRALGPVITLLASLSAATAPLLLIKPRHESAGPVTAGRGRIPRLSPLQRSFVLLAWPGDC